MDVRRSTKFLHGSSVGIKADGTTVYGVSIYVQMTDKELKAMQDSAK